MWIILILLSIGALGIGILATLTATTMMHQIVGHLSFVCAAVLFSGAAIISTIRQRGQGFEAAMSSRLDKIIAALEVPSEPNPVKPTETKGALMARYGIECDGGKYIYQTFKYDHFEDAVAYAENSKS